MKRSIKYVLLYCPYTVKWLNQQQFKFYCSKYINILRENNKKTKLERKLNEKPYFCDVYEKSIERRKRKAKKIKQFKHLRIIACYGSIKL